MHRLILWDIDRTLLFVGQNDRLLYSEICLELVGRRPATYDQAGMGRMEPDVVRAMFADCGVPRERIDEYVARAIEMLPAAMKASTLRMQRIGSVVPCALEALRAANSLVGTISSVVTGNLRETAELKMTAFGLDRYVDLSIGAYASDAPIRSRLVEIARARATAAVKVPFHMSNTLIIGDAVADIVAGHEGGAFVISVATGRATDDELRAAGADVVLPNLCDRLRLIEVIEQNTYQYPAEE